MGAVVSWCHGHWDAAAVAAACSRLALMELQGVAVKVHLQLMPRCEAAAPAVDAEN
jgi:hypothetical protein